MAIIAWEQEEPAYLYSQEQNALEKELVLLLKARVAALASVGMNMVE